MRIMRQNRHRKVGERKKKQRKGSNRLFRSLPVAALPWVGALCGKHGDCVGKTRQENSVALSALLSEFLNSPQTRRRPFMNKAALFLLLGVAANGAVMG